MNGFTALPRFLKKIIEDFNILCYISNMIKIFEYEESLKRYLDLKDLLIPLLKREKGVV